MRYLKSKNIWMSEDGTLYASDKKTVIGKATIINHFKPGPEPETWIDTKGDVYDKDRKTIIKTAEEIARERLRAHAAAKKEAERVAREQRVKILKEQEKARRAANREGQRKINERKLEETFGKKVSSK